MDELHSNLSEQPIPPWLRWGVLITFCAVMLGGLFVAILLTLGAANPVKGDLRATLPPTTLTPGQSISLPFLNPQESYTLEISAHFTAGSDPSAAWGLFSDDLKTLKILVYNNGYFSSPDSADQVEFPHLKTGKKSNTLSFTVQPTGAAVLRLNDEIAWQGKITGVPYSIRLANADSMPNSAVFVELIAFYSTTSIP